MSSERRMSWIEIVVLVSAAIWATTALLAIIGRVVHVLATVAFTILIVAALAAFIARMLVGSNRKEER
jgi:hypothetical protein